MTAGPRKTTTWVDHGTRSRVSMRAAGSTAVAVICLGAATHTLCHPRESGDPVHTALAIQTVRSFKVARSITLTDAERHSQTPRGEGAGMFKEYCIYILASRKGGTLYIGVTNDLI